MGAERPAPSQKDESMAETQARKEWTKEHTTFVCLKLNKSTEKDIFDDFYVKKIQKEIMRIIIQCVKQDQSEH